MALAAHSKLAARFLVTRIDSLVVPSLSIRRSVQNQAWVYEKNAEEQVAEDQVQVMKAEEHYWSPHPQTGVFRPAKDHLYKPAAAAAAASSALEQKAFFRPLDLEDYPLRP